MKTKVYRLEKDGRGPYIDPPDDISSEEQLILEKMNTVHSFKKVNGVYTHPSASNDFNNPDIALYCGFKSLEDLKKWFRGFLAPLKRMGFIITIYKVDPKWIQIGNSNKQLMFLP